VYKNILIPTDGSKLSTKAVKGAINLAKTLGAKVTVFYATPEYPTPVYSEGAVFTSYVSRADFNRAQAEGAAKVLAAIEKLAASAGVAMTGEHAASNAPYESILKVAAKRKCDLIVMASHGRRGLSAMLLGSETQKVLTHSKIPVLVVR
jgi:nucleotide-binding universal stress UspA family protein